MRVGFIPLSKSELLVDFSSSRSGVEPMDGKDLLVYNKNARLLERIEQSYALIQEGLRAQFPADDEAAYEETLDLYEEEWQERSERREALYEEAEQFKSLFIDGLRSGKDEQEQPHRLQQM